MLPLAASVAAGTFRLQPLHRTTMVVEEGGTGTGTSPYFQIWRNAPMKTSDGRYALFARQARQITYTGRTGRPRVRLGLRAAASPAIDKGLASFNEDWHEEKLTLKAVEREEKAKVSL